MHECGHCITRKKNSASNQGTGQYDGKKRIDSALPVYLLAFPFSRFAVFPFRHAVLQAKHVLRRRALNGWKSLKVKFYYNI